MQNYIVIKKFVLDYYKDIVIVHISFLKRNSHQTNIIKQFKISWKLYIKIEYDSFGHILAHCDFARCTNWTFQVT